MSMLEMIEGAEETGLWKLEDVISVFNHTENLEERQFEMLGDTTYFKFMDDEDKLIMKIAREPFGISREAFLQACKMIGLPKGYSEKTPVELVVQNLNYWFANKGGERKALAHRGNVVSFVRPGTEVYSTVQILTSIVEALKELGHTDLSFDKVYHTVEETQFLVILNDKQYTLPNGHVVKAAYQVQNSLTAIKPLVITTALYHQSGDIHGASVSRRSYSQWNRKLGFVRPEEVFSDELIPEPDDLYDVYAWTKSSIGDLYNTFNREVELVKNTQNINIGSHAGTFFNDICVRYKIPTALRSVVQEEYADQDGQTVYDLWVSICNTSGREEASDNVAQIRHMMLVAGEIALHPESCPSCHRLTID